VFPFFRRTKDKELHNTIDHQNNKEVDTYTFDCGLRDNKEDKRKRYAFQ
jgi:hypothetical protein